MSYLFTQVFPALHTLKILGNTNTFKNWLYNEYAIENNQQIFDGYVFAIGCCLNTLADGLANDYQLQIENDFLLERALHQALPLYKIENSCEKTVLLKWINPYIKVILQSKSYVELSKALDCFQSKIIYRLDQLYAEKITINPKAGVSKEIATKLSLVNFVHTYMVQINNNGPIANFLNPLFPKWLNKERGQHCFEGYKYALQFVWYKLLGRKSYNSTSLTKMHLADSWRAYKYIENTEAQETIIPDRRFIIEEQNCLDSYFWRIKNEITDKLEVKHGQILHTMDTCFRFNSRQYSKRKYFSDLLTRITPDKPSHLSFDDKIQEALYWYPFEIIDGENTPTHLGIPSFNTMLAGTVTLRNNGKSAFPNTIVVKFTHPLPGKENKNDYSYGILIDSKSAAGHYYCGWVIYQNVCGDYSGFSGMEYKETEKLIQKYSRQGNIELRELHIPLDKFKEFTEKKVNNKAHTNSFTYNKEVNDIIQKSRAYCFELFTYYLHSQHYKNKFDTVSLNADKKSPTGERDVVLQSKTEVLLIECKLNPNNYDLRKEIKKIKNKLSEYKQPKKSCAIWCWHEVSTQNESLLKENNITYVVVSVPSEVPVLKGVSLKQLRFIMSDQAY